MKVSHYGMLGAMIMILCLAVSGSVVGQEVVNIGRVFQGFSAADIDTTATFAGDIQGINLGNVVAFGPLTADETVGEVVLLRQDNAAAANIIVNPDPAGIAGQAPPSLGPTADDDALERVFGFGEFEGTTGFDVSFPVVSGADYKVTSLFFEFISITRTFDITIDGALAVDEFSVIQNDGNHQDALSGVSTTSFSAHEAIVTASGPTLVVGYDPGETVGSLHPLAAQDPDNFGTLEIADGTPFVHGIIVERVPEPTTALMALAGIGVCGLARRRR